MLSLSELYLNTAEWFLDEKEPDSEELALQLNGQEAFLLRTAQALDEFWFTPSPPAYVRKALELAELQPSDVILDVGAGDGRLALMALQAFGVRKAYAIEANPIVVHHSRPLLQSIPGLIYAEGVFQTAKFASEVTAAFFLAWHCPEKTVYKLKDRLRAETQCRILIHNSGTPFSLTRVSLK